MSSFKKPKTSKPSAAATVADSPAPVAQRLKKAKVAPRARAPADSNSDADAGSDSDASVQLPPAGKGKGKGKPAVGEEEDVGAAVSSDAASEGMEPAVPAFAPGSKLAALPWRKVSYMKASMRNKVNDFDGLMAVDVIDGDSYTASMAKQSKLEAARAAAERAAEKEEELRNKPMSLKEKRALQSQKDKEAARAAKEAAKAAKVNPAAANANACKTAAVAAAAKKPAAAAANDSDSDSDESDAVMDDEEVDAFLTTAIKSGKLVPPSSDDDGDADDSDADDSGSESESAKDAFFTRVIKGQDPRHRVPDSDDEDDDVTAAYNAATGNGGAGDCDDAFTTWSDGEDTADDANAGYSDEDFDGVEGDEGDMFDFAGFGEGDIEGDIAEGDEGDFGGVEGDFEGDEGDLMGLEGDEGDMLFEGDDGELELEEDEDGELEFEQDDDSAVPAHLRALAPVTVLSKERDLALAHKELKESKERAAAAAAAALAAKNQSHRIEVVTPGAADGAEGAAGAEGQGKNGAPRHTLYANTDAFHRENRNMIAWAPLPLHPLLLSGLRSLGFVAPTRIQLDTMLPALRDWKDVVGAAQTGSGKTMAYVLPIMNEVLRRRARRAEQLCRARPEWRGVRAPSLEQVAAAGDDAGVIFSDHETGYGGLYAVLRGEKRRRIAKEEACRAHKASGARLGRKRGSSGVAHKDDITDADWRVEIGRAHV